MLAPQLITPDSDLPIWFLKGSLGLAGDQLRMQNVIHAGFEVQPRLWTLRSCCPRVLGKQSHSQALLLVLCHCACLFIPLDTNPTPDWVFRTLEVQNGFLRFSSFSSRADIFLLG